MNVAIISAGTAPIYYDSLEKCIDKLIETSGCYLFNILCGFVEGRTDGKPSLGEIYAKNNGAPILYITEKTTEKLINKLFFKADYIFFLLDGDPFINKLFMRYKMTGKHGSAIKISNGKD